MTPEQRMEVVRWMLDSIDRIIEKSEPPAIAKINHCPPEQGEREETEHPLLTAFHQAMIDERNQLRDELAEVRRQHEQTREERYRYAKRCVYLEDRSEKLWQLRNDVQCLVDWWEVSLVSDNKFLDYTLIPERYMSDLRKDAAALAALPTEPAGEVQSE